MSPPFIFSGHGIDDGLTPIYRRGGGEIVLGLTINNSSAAGILNIGTFNFPNYGVRHPGIFRVSVRDADGDRDVFENEWSNPVEPPWRVQVAEVLSGDLFNAGSSAWRSVGPNCVNLGNGSRIQFNAGVPGTHNGVYSCQFRNSTSAVENICPVPDPRSTELIAEFTVAINATFTG